MKARVTIALAIAIALTGCGGSSLSASQLRTGAGRICGQAQRLTRRIITPTGPNGESTYLRQGIAALGPELTDLRQLHPPSDMAGRYRDAIDAMGAEVGDLRSTLTDLKAGNDPVVAIKTLQHNLTRPERRAQSAWQSLSVPACLQS